ASRRAMEGFLVACRWAARACARVPKSRGPSLGSGLAGGSTLPTKNDSRALVNAMIAPAEIGEDLVSDRAHPGGNLIDANAVADQDREVATAGLPIGKIGDVHG